MIILLSWWTMNKLTKRESKYRKKIIYEWHLKAEEQKKFDFSICGTYYNQYVFNKSVY